jgi:hypothetical protein
MAIEFKLYHLVRLDPSDVLNQDFHQVFNSVSGEEVLLEKNQRAFSVVESTSWHPSYVGNKVVVGRETVGVIALGILTASTLLEALDKGSVFFKLIRAASNGARLVIDPVVSETLAEELEGLRPKLGLGAGLKFDRWQEQNLIDMFKQAAGTDGFVVVC